jgi:hypothetical protein
MSKILMVCKYVMLQRGSTSSVPSLFSVQAINRAFWGFGISIKVASTVFSVCTEDINRYKFCSLGVGSKIQYRVSGGTSHESYKADSF